MIWGYLGWGGDWEAKWKESNVGTIRRQTKGEESASPGGSANPIGRGGERRLSLELQGGLSHPLPPGKGKGNLGKTSSYRTDQFKVAFIMGSRKEKEAHFPGRRKKGTRALADL